MSDEDSTKPPEENKLPRLKIPGSSDKTGDKPEKVTPEVGRISEMESDTTKLELSEAIPGEKDAANNATMRINIDEAVLPGSGPDQSTGATQPMDGGEPGDATSQLHVNEMEAEKGKTGPIKSDTTKLSLDDAIEGKDTSKILMETEAPQAGMGETMPITDLGITSEIKSDTTKLDLADALKERATKSPTKGTPPGESADKSSTIEIGEAPGMTDAEGIQETGKLDDEFFKSATMPIEGADEAEQEITGKPSIDDSFSKSATVPIEGAPTGDSGEGIQEDKQVEDEFFKSATMPIDMGAQEASEGIQETGKMDDEFFKSATMPIDMNDEAGDAPAPGADLDSDDDFFKSATVPFKGLPESDESPDKDQSVNLEAGATAAAAAGGRPRTIKIKKPSAKQLDTVKLQKSPAVEDESVQTGGTEATPPARKQTVKLKRGGTATSAGKTLAVSRPPAGSPGPGAGAAAINADDAVMGTSTMPGAVFSVLALLSFFLTCTGLYFLYTAYTTIAG